MDLAMGPDRPYSLVTTVVRRRGDRCKLIQIDLHLRSGDVRLRFDDSDTLWRFTAALDALLSDISDPDPRAYSPVRTRVYTDTDALLETEPRTASQLSLF